MKAINLLILAMTFSLFTNLSFAGLKTDMKELAQKVDLVEYGSLPAGYTKKEVKTPKFGKRLTKIFKDLAQDRYEMFQDALEHYEEYEYITAEEKKDALKDPAKFLQVDYLVEAYTAFKIYKDNKFIGYVIVANDNVRADIIQDGAWMEIFITKYHKLVEIKEHEA